MPGEVYELLGDIEVHPDINNYKQAQDYYKMSVAAKPNRVDIYIKLARTHEKLRELEEAILNYNKCLRRDKQNFTALQRLGLAYMKNNQRYEGVLYL